MLKIYRVVQTKIESVGLRKCPCDHWLTNKAYLSAITVTNIAQSFYLQDGGKNQPARHCHPVYISNNNATAKGKYKYYAKYKHPKTTTMCLRVNESRWLEYSVVWRNINRQHTSITCAISARIQYMRGWEVRRNHRRYIRPKTVTHAGTNRARRGLTSFMRGTPLTTTPRRQRSRNDNAIMCSKVKVAHTRLPSV